MKALTSRLFTFALASLISSYALFGKAEKAHAEAMPLVGLNLSSAGFAGQALPGVNGTH
ncbi:hypothetical protein [Pseudomonas oryzihabitans]|uniref:hypothetical protein n=1 Tax=Pseudomonas oryzihabitans TaxID=47885 RepID=UPI001F0E878C|nr:hypothetical protein [Pseudomonas psychrotolerans]